MIKRSIIALCALFLLSSCSKLNMENYDKLESGMKYEEVVAIIGSPAECSEKLGTRRCIWGDDEGANIKANFINERAIFFSHDELK